MTDHIGCQLKLILRPAQERQLLRWLPRLTGAWNWAIRKLEADDAAGIRYSRYDFLTLVNGHSPKVGILETAPRDGRQVLLWWPYWRWNVPVIGFWSVNEGWQSNDALEGESEPPTHWMPLPAPPASPSLPREGEKR